jgi:hypothetical protein
VGINGDRIGGGLDPLDRESHFVMPGTRATLCAEPITDEWEGVEADSILVVTCRQCHSQRYWLPVAGRLDRDAEIAKVVEPWPRGARKHVTGDDDPGRGRLHRPEQLQLCLTCGELRGPYSGFDDLCECDRSAWDREPRPRYGDLFNNVHLCKSCITTLVGSGTRWSPFHCAECMPAVQLWRSMAMRSIVPIGPHSLMNGVGWKSEGRPMTSAQATAFSDQLNALFATQQSLHDLAAERALDAARRLGFEGHAVLARDFLAARRAAGSTAQSGFAELVAAYSDADTSELAEHIWAVILDKRDRSRPSTGPSGED